MCRAGADCGLGYTPHVRVQAKAPSGRPDTRRFARLAAAASVLFLIAAAAAAPAFAKKKGKGKGGGSADSGAPKRVAIMSGDVKASEDGPVRAQLTKVLKKHKIRVAPKPKGDAPSDEQAWMALARKLKVDGLLIPVYEGDKKKRSVEIIVRTAADGSIAATETFNVKGPPKKLAAVVGKTFWKQLGTSLEQVHAPAPGQEGTGMPARDLSRDSVGSEAPKPLAEADKEKAGEEPASPTEAGPATSIGSASSTSTEVAEKPASAEAGEKPPTAAVTAKARPPAEPKQGAGSSAGPRLPALTVRLAGRFVSRSFVYTGGSAVPATSASTPTVAASASWFPITYVGLAMSGEFASWLKFAGTYPAVTSDLTGGLVLRIPLSFGEITGHAGGFRHIFAIQDDGSGTRTDQVLPDLVYLGARVGGGITYHLTDAFTVAAEASYRLITDMSGGAYAVTNKDFYFPDAVPGPGVDAGLTLSYRVTPAIEVLAGFDLRRYVLSVRGGNGTRIDAIYLTDQSWAGWVGVGGVFGGK